MLILPSRLYKLDRSALGVHRENPEFQGFHRVPTPTGHGAPGRNPATPTIALWHLAFPTCTVIRLLPVLDEWQCQSKGVAQCLFPKFHCQWLPGFMNKLFSPRELVQKHTGSWKSQKPTWQCISPHKKKNKFRIVLVSFK